MHIGGLSYIFRTKESKVEQTIRRTKLFVGFSSVALMLFFIVFGASNIKAENTVDPWIVLTNPNLSEPQDLASGQSSPPTLAGYGNVDCQMHTFVTRPAKVGLSQKSHESCAVRTLYGLVDPNGYISLNGTKVSGKLKTPVGTDSFITPIPDSPNAIVLQNTSGGIKLHIYKNISRRLRVEKNILTGEFSYFLPETPSKTLRDTNGNDLFVRPESISFSSNGKWMVVDSQSVAMLRVNLDTYQITPFKSPYTYSLGQSPLPNTAISDDGKYAASTSRAKDLQIIDIDSCQASSTSLLTYSTCSSKDHGPFVNSKIPGGLGAAKLRFINNRLLTFYASYLRTSTTRQLAKYRLLPAGDSHTNVDYMALGDSFASGEGAYDYFSETDTSENMCHLSKSSYPYLIGEQLGLNSYNSVACSGAKIENISQYVQKENIPSPNNMGDLLPGYKRQIQYIKKYQPNVVTIGIGGNDIGFGKAIIQCVGYSVIPNTCYRYYEDRLEIVRLINKQFTRFVETFSELKSGVKPGTKIYMLGYPEVAKNNGNCAVNVRLNNEEVEFSNLLIEYLNTVIERSAKKEGVRYVDVGDAFVGHKLCEVDSQFSAVNGVTAGNNRLGIIANEGFHPNRLGHQLYKAKILEQTSNFTQSMPLPDTTINSPTEDFSLPILQVPSSGRQVNVVQPDENLTQNEIYKDKEQTFQVQSTQHSLKANTQYRAELHSEPSSLGTFTTNSEGDLFGAFTIPIDIDPGYHTLHIYGPNLNDEPIDIYKTVFVGASENDYDGDGVQNQLDSCPDDQNSGVDADQDSIDDACDDNIVIKDVEIPPAKPAVEVDQPADEPEVAEPPEESNPTNDDPQTQVVELPSDPGVIDSQPDLPPAQGEIIDTHPVIEDESHGVPLALVDSANDPTPKDEVKINVDDKPNQQNNNQSNEGINEIATNSTGRAVSGEETVNYPTEAPQTSLSYEKNRDRIIILVSSALVLGIIILIRHKKTKNSN